VAFFGLILNVLISNRIQSDTIGYNWIQNGYKLDTRETILATGSGSGVKYHCKEEEL